jgi:hypothetical protein
VEELRRQIQPKRTHTDDDAGDGHEVLAEVESWDLRDHRQQATRVQNRRNEQLGSRQNQAKPRADTDGFFNHTCLGLVGWISYWCLGDSVLAVDIIVTTNDVEHTDMKIQQVVVMYLHDHQIRVCVAEDTDPSPVDRISWWKVVLQVDLLDRRRIYCHNIIRDSES